MGFSTIECPDCGATIKLKNGMYRCKCGFELEEENYFEVNEFGELVTDECEYDDDDMPEGCAACGGDYPNCVDSCPMYD